MLLLDYFRVRFRAVNKHKYLAAMWEGSGHVSGNRIYKQVPKRTVESLSLEISRA